ncbi:ribonucleoside-diphosphate reductase subunit alpha [Chryseobacterium phage MA9V-2]|nr:ribonucleoside-diphosphate reductase subunit alpha [Chryseobacterium phage MA9V-2]
MQERNAPSWINEESLAMLNRGYLLPGETVNDAIDRICKAAASYFVGTKYEADAYSKFRRNIENNWISFSSPVWSNMGTNRGLPISCFNTHIPDEMFGIANKHTENVMMSKLGGGTSSYWGELRARGTNITDNGKAGGPVPFMKMFDTMMTVISQGGVRRGSHAAYLDIDHADIEEFLQIKEIGNDIQNLFTGVNVPDYWMNDMINGDTKKREIWAKVLESRKTKGLPYIFFTDNVNKNKPQIYKDRKADIKSSNLCAEIMLPSTLTESFVCCLSSINLIKWDEIKDTDAIFWAILFLDAVMQEFINKTKDMPGMAESRAFAERHRAIGLGVLGYHAYLQSKMVAFDSFEATRINNSIFKQLGKQTKEASEEIGKELGFAPIFLEGETTDIPRRHTTTMALPPTTSSSSISQIFYKNEDGSTEAFGNSPGIEPYSSNYYKAGLAKGNFMRTNGFLKRLLVEKGLDNEDIWRGIMLNHGSVQHINELSDHEKNVFKTFKEISPSAIITQAAQRQVYVDQGQSLNLLIPTEMSVKDVNRLYIEAWEKGVKTLYYQRSSSVSKEMMTGFVTCNSCEA